MIIRVLEATSNIPVGTLIEIDHIGTGSTVEKVVNGTAYKFSVDGVQPITANKFKIWNSNLIAVVEVVE